MPIVCNQEGMGLHVPRIPPSAAKYRLTCSLSLADAAHLLIPFAKTYVCVPDSEIDEATPPDGNRMDPRTLVVGLFRLPKRIQAFPYTAWSRSVACHSRVELGEFQDSESDFDRQIEIAEWLSYPNARHCSVWAFGKRVSPLWRHVDARYAYVRCVLVNSSLVTEAE